MAPGRGLDALKVAGGGLGAGPLWGAWGQMLRRRRGVGRDMVRGLRVVRRGCSVSRGVANGATGRGGVLWRRGAGAALVVPKGCPAAESVGRGKGETGILSLPYGEKQT